MPQAHDEIDAVLASPPSLQGWKALCAALSRLSGEELTDALARAAPIREWPPTFRLVNPADEAHRWFEPLLVGTIDPRLTLIGSAYVALRAHPEAVTTRFDKESLRPAISTFARHIEPTFAPPERSLEVRWYESGDNRRMEERFGDATRGFAWEDDSYGEDGEYFCEGIWHPYGLEDRARRHVQLGRKEWGIVGKDTFQPTRRVLTFKASGPVPLILELTYAWCTLQRTGTFTEQAAVLALEESRKAWQQQMAGLAAP